ncbi:MAG: hypothetical protein JWM19_6574 [Actinomycetia bacterium]|nr:hypothetical protein [Actinomycetes bacterium]
MPLFTLPFSTRIRPSAPRRPVWLALAAAVAASVTLACFAPSALAESTSIATYNRPSVTELGGAEYLAWADETNSGSVHVAKLTSGGGISVQWTDPHTATYYGTGPTIASVSGTGIVVAWTNLSDHHLWVGVPQGSGGANGSNAFCSEDLTQAMNESIGVAPGFSYPNIASSDATPYLTSEGDDGSGALFLTWVDGASSYMHVTRLIPPSGGCGTWTLASNQNIYTDKSWDGPAMVVSGYGGTEHYWLMWAGSDSQHEINIAEYDTAWNRIGKSTESTHSTKTDMGGAYFTASGSIWMSYCGTNDAVYYQEFTTVSGGLEIQEPGASCLPETYTPPGSSTTFWSGGVGVNYEYSSQFMRLAWPDKTSSLVQIATI